MDYTYIGVVYVFFFCLFVLFLYRKQLSEYLPASVLKQKKRSSAAPSDGKKEVNFFYFILLLYLGIYFVHGIGFYLLYCLPKQDKCRAVIKRRGPGISPSYYERLPRLLSKENERKIEPKEIPSCLIPRLVVVFTRQLEILVTTL